MSKISIIVAVADNNVIGMNNKTPWHIVESLKHFKEITMGKPCIMGRKTYESILEQLGKPLPGRDLIVITRQGFEDPRIITTSSLERAIEKAEFLDAEEIMVIGGSQIYALALPIANRIYLTRVHQEPEGDAFFPEFGTDWKETEFEHHDGFSFLILERN